MWKVLLLFVTIPQLSLECGHSINTALPDKIVGGRNADEGEYPWQASLQKKTPFGYLHTCGACLIAPEWLLTAAHCIKGNSTKAYRVMIGSNNLKSYNADQIYLVKMIAVKQGFDPKTFNNDIALIQIVKASTSEPICLSESGADLNETALVGGWGATADGGPASEKLQTAEVSIISRSDCLSSYGALTESMMCAGYMDGGIDACQGDSGGPLLQWRNGLACLIGIVSWGVGCAEPGHPGVYTDVTKFIPWIQHYVSLSSQK